MSQFSEHDPFTQETQFLNALAEPHSRGRWQRRVITIAAGLLALLLLAIPVSFVVEAIH
jgi:hypothetical protein